MEFKRLHKSDRLYVTAVYNDDGSFRETRIVIIDADGYDEKEIAVKADGKYEIA